MKPVLSDTTADAIRFLLLGAGVILLLRLLYAAIALWSASPLTADLPVAIAELRNGYLLNDPMTLVVGGSPVGTRLALAALLTGLCAVAIAILGALLARPLGFSPIRTAVTGARIALFVCGIWWFFAALVLPPRSVQVGTSELVRTVRPSVLGELSLPWSGTETRVGMDMIDGIEHRSLAASSAPCGWNEKVEAVSGTRRMELASISPEGDDCEAARKIATDRLRRLAELLEQVSHTGAP